ncbi:hypothetical protein E2320_012104 [Naja naja]|nr:hypothetical protein E2320_012104 [Naja naja]
MAWKPHPPLSPPPSYPSRVKRVEAHRLNTQGRLSAPEELQKVSRVLGRDLLAAEREFGKCYRPQIAQQRRWLSRPVGAKLKGIFCFSLGETNFPKQQQQQKNPKKKPPHREC